MKKVFASVLALCLALALVGCGSADTPADNNANNDADSASVTVAPMQSAIDVNSITDADLAVSFDAASLHTEGDAATLDVTVYDYELYDAAEVSQLKVGDTITANGQDIVITSIDTTDGVTINGGFEQDGLSLVGGEGGTMYAVGPNDSKTYRELGTVTLPLSDGCQLLDSSDLAGGEIKVTLPDLAAYLAEDVVTFQPANTTVTVAGGQITGITRVYMP